MKTTLLLTAALCFAAYASGNEDCPPDEETRTYTYSENVDLDGVEPLDEIATETYTFERYVWNNDCTGYHEVYKQSRFTHTIPGLEPLVLEFQTSQLREDFDSQLRTGDTDGDGDLEVLHIVFHTDDREYGTTELQLVILDEEDSHIPAFEPPFEPVRNLNGFQDLNGDGLFDFDLGSAGQFINQGPGASPRYLRSDLIPPPPPLFEEGKLFEYAFGEVEPVVEFGRDKSLSIQYQRRQDTPVRYAIETSTNLRQWHAGNLEETVEDLGNGWERVSASYTPPSFASVGYARVTARFTAP